ncbi:hypothetical protein SODALDRAFT_362381 [Sodiomyces alkalinus F11]|uniref:Uncharacterized protein n=1 Tax=Sodiomyces alkalinus (strain CBS 110278 / VKM F-3762 / F11) TaxID=1314773 RepID=A0A3N2PPX8_SODAK|nr:hypothetical protein SODALDRAFT_362381 [Sodiomyces alkalinus F11]ROT36567.1 hypothetical protein SODALDRAFT_362381 [Sodiomyces alkalinus F11]
MSVYKSSRPILTARALRTRPIAQRFFSKTTPRLAPSSSNNTNPSFPASPKEIWRNASPPVRFVLVAGLVVAACAEGAMWSHFARSWWKGAPGEGETPGAGSK